MSDYGDDFEDDFESDSERSASAIKSKKSKRGKSRVGSASPFSATPSKARRQSTAKDTRLWSANHKRKDELVNKLVNAERQLKDAKDEIRLLNRMQRRSDKELSKVTGSDAELPRTLIRRTEELRTVETQLRSVKGKLSDAGAEIKKKDKALLKATDQNRKLKALAGQRG